MMEIQKKYCDSKMTNKQNKPSQWGHGSQTGHLPQCLWPLGRPPAMLVPPLCLLPLHRWLLNWDLWSGLHKKTLFCHFPASGQSLHILLDRQMWNLRVDFHTSSCLLLQLGSLHILSYVPSDCLLCVFIYLSHDYNPSAGSYQLMHVLLHDIHLAPPTPNFHIFHP